MPACFATHEIYHSAFDNTLDLRCEVRSHITNRRLQPLATLKSLPFDSENVDPQTQGTLSPRQQE